MFKRALNRLVVSTTVAVLACAVASAAPIKAGFDDGNGNTLVDQYQGAGGAGWDAGWLTPAMGNGATGVGTVVNTNPLSAGGGNYLSFAVNRSNPTATGEQFSGPRRKWTDASISSQPHTISWKFRLDDASLTFNGGSDSILFADKIATDSSTGTGGGMTWGVRVQGGTTNGTAAAPRWFAYTGNGSGGATNTPDTDTGVVLVPGTVYHFAVTVRPGVDWATTFYDVAIDGTTVLTDLKFRNTTVTTSGGNLQFIGYSETANESRTFSIDDVMVQVPEPMSIAAFGLAATGLLFRRRRLTGK